MKLRVMNFRQKMEGLPCLFLDVKKAEIMVHIVMVYKGYIIGMMDQLLGGQWIVPSGQYQVGGDLKKHIFKLIKEKCRLIVKTMRCTLVTLDVKKKGVMTRHVGFMVRVDGDILVREGYLWSLIHINSIREVQFSEEVKIMVMSLLAIMQNDVRELKPYQLYPAAWVSDALRIPLHQNYYEFYAPRRWCCGIRENSVKAKQRLIKKLDKMVQKGETDICTLVCKTKEVSADRWRHYTSI